MKLQPESMKWTLCFNNRADNNAVIRPGRLISFLVTYGVTVFQTFPDYEVRCQIILRRLCLFLHICGIKTTQ